ncbi:MAG: WYL domain-containing protein [Proteobacteria bacterium]|nr:WYL domain-containing protein [Pseudomonadota bacterium]
MSKTDRVYKIEALIRNRGHVSFQVLLDELEVSRATLKRDLEYLRDRLGAPIEYDRYLNAYRFAEGARDRRHELPGLWFNERELYSLLMANQLLSDLDTEGAISRHLKPLFDRIHQMLGTTEAQAQALLTRVRIVSSGKRPVATEYFELVAQALLERKCIEMNYLSRGRGAMTERTVSPQRLMHYRNTWYLDAWCHTRERMLRFALDAIDSASILDQAVHEVDLAQVAAEMDAGYGIYAGSRRHWATLHFSREAAQWVSKEKWHPEQEGRLQPDGSYLLELPYAEETELVMDVLRHGDQVKVLGPKPLARKVAEKLRQGAAQYT